MISLIITAAPRPLKNPPTPIGETLIGRHGRKYRIVSNGEKNATPNPPSVMASSTPCEAVAKKNSPRTPHNCPEPLATALNSQNPPDRPHSAANNRKGDSPGCPRKPP